MKRPSADSGTEVRRALFVSPEAPYPMTGGGALRSASLLEYLAANYRVDLLLFRQPGAPDPAAEIPRDLAGVVAVFQLPHHGKSAAARLWRNAVRALGGRPPLFDRYSGFEAAFSQALRGRSYEVAIIEHFWCAGYGEPIRPVARRLVIDLHNVESALAERLAAEARWPVSMMMQRFAAGYRRLERELLPRFDLCLTASQADLDRISEYRVEGRVFPNALPSRPTATAVEEEHCVAFSGNLEYTPNQGAVRFFFHSIWPKLRESWPDLEWKVIGKNPEAVRDIVRGDPRVSFPGPIPDAVEALARCEVVVVPLLAGSGTRFKILEAWAAGRAVVSTSVGAEGLEAVDREHLLIAESAADFAAAVHQLLSDRDLRWRIGQAGQKYFLARYTWESAWEHLKTAGI